MDISFDDIVELNKKHVHVKNKEDVIKKINLLIKGGNENLQIVTDYDMTLTKQHENGLKHISSFGMMEQCASFPKDCYIKTRALLEKYRPIEFDPHMSHEEKLNHMFDWWRASIDILRGVKLPAEEFDEVTKNYQPPLRDGTFEMFHDLHEAQVPILVFSAGLGNSVEAVLKYRQIFLPNVKVVSNYLDFDENSVIQGYKNKIITVLNKNEQALEGTDYYNSLVDRGNVILMGDHVGDATMVDGVPKRNSVLKIGFLYERIEESLPEYMNVFDIVLVDDQTMDVTRAILKLILKK